MVDKEHDLLTTELLGYPPRYTSSGLVQTINLGREDVRCDKMLISQEKKVS